MKKVVTVVRFGGEPESFVEDSRMLSPLDPPRFQAITALRTLLVSREQGMQPMQAARKA